VRTPFVPIRAGSIAGLGAALVVSAWLAACAAKTEIPNAWRNPAHEGTPYQKVFVIGIGENDANRRLFEDHFAEVLSRKETVASPSYGALPKSERLTEAEIREAIRGGNFGAVVITRALGVEEKQEYVPPRTYTVPSHYYGGFYGYYGASWDVVHEPGYYRTYTIVRLETNLYDVGTGDLVWTGQSETFNPSSLEEIIGSATKAVAKRLRKEKLVH
jgi:hypothetical protein